MSYGRGAECLIMDAVISGTTPIVSQVVDIMDQDDIGLQLIIETPTRVFFSKAGDTVTAGTHTWVLANGGFLATDVNGTLKSSGSANSNNNATVTISSRTNGTTIVTNGTQTDETFTADEMKFIVTPPFASTTGAGTWLVEVSGDLEEDGVPALNQVANSDTAHWSNATALFTPTISNPDGSTAAKSNQFTRSQQLCSRRLRVTFTPSSGAGTARVIITGKGSH